MATGTVKWFTDSKGFGFITQDAGGEDLFVHFSDIQSSGFKSLAEGQKVEYEVVEGPKGKQASNDLVPEAKVGRLLAIPPSGRLSASKVCFKVTRNTGGSL